MISEKNCIPHQMELYINIYHCSIYIFIRVIITYILTNYMSGQTDCSVPHGHYSPTLMSTRVGLALVGQLKLHFHHCCHALVLVFCVFFINLVRPGCDMGFVCGVFCLGVFVRYWVCGLVGVSSIVYGCLEWFSIRGRCLSLSLIGNHI